MREEIQENCCQLYEEEGKRKTVRKLDGYNPRNYGRKGHMKECGAGHNSRRIKKVSEGIMVIESISSVLIKKKISNRQ